eukprot:1910756-Prymnesium_polylepis.3
MPQHARCCCGRPSAPPTAPVSTHLRCATTRTHFEPLPTTPAPPTGAHQSTIRAQWERGPLTPQADAPDVLISRARHDSHAVRRIAHGPHGPVWSRVVGPNRLLLHQRQRRRVCARRTRIFTFQHTARRCHLEHT